jgi:hypothetical protein
MQSPGLSALERGIVPPDPEDKEWDLLPGCSQRCCRASLPYIYVGGILVTFRGGG